MSNYASLLTQNNSEKWSYAGPNQKLYQQIKGELAVAAEREE